MDVLTSKSTGRTIVKVDNFLIHVCVVENNILLPIIQLNVAGDMKAITCSVVLSYLMFIICYNMLRYNAIKYYCTTTGFINYSTMPQEKLLNRYIRLLFTLKYMIRNDEMMVF